MYNSVDQSIEEILENFESDYFPHSKIEVGNGNISTDFSSTDREIISVVETPVLCIDKHNS